MLFALLALEPPPGFGLELRLGGVLGGLELLPAFKSRPLRALGMLGRTMVYFCQLRLGGRTIGLRLLVQVRASNDQQLGPYQYLKKRVVIRQYPK